MNKRVYHTIDRADTSPGSNGNGSQTTVLYEYLTEFYQRSSTITRYGKTAEHKLVTFFSPEDERMFQWHGYHPEIWDTCELPHDILIGIERRRGDWRVKTMEPAEHLPFWCDADGAHWVACDELKPGQQVFTPKLTSHRLIRIADKQPKDDRVYWVVQVEDTGGTYPETETCYYKDYQYLVVETVFDADPLPEEMRETV